MFEKTNLIKTAKLEKDHDTKNIFITFLNDWS